MVQIQKDSKQLNKLFSTKQATSHYVIQSCDGMPWNPNSTRQIMQNLSCFRVYVQKTTQRPNCLFLLRNMAPNTPLTTHLFGLLRGRTSWCSGRCRTCRPKRLLETRWCCSHKRSGAKSGHESSRKIPTIDTFLPRICLNMLKLLFVSGCFAVSPSNLTIWSNLIKVPFSIKPEWFEWFRWQLYIIYT